MVDGSLFLGKQIDTYSKLNSVYARYKALRNEENSCVDLIEIISRREPKNQKVKLAKERIKSKLDGLATRKAAM